MKKFTRQQKTLICAASLMCSGQVAAAPIQVLLNEDFQGVSGITTNATVRTVEEILTNSPGELSGSPLTSFSSTGNGSASEAAFNVRRGNNAIDGTSPIAVPMLSNDNFDNFFGANPNQFLVLGDNLGNLGGAPNGGTNVAASATMSIQFALGPVAGSPDVLQIMFDYVFDANDLLNTDDFVAELILSDTSSVNLLSFDAPTAATRGSYNTSILYSSLVATPAYLNFRLIEGRGNGSSAVGLDNLVVNAIPEPGMLALMGLGLLGLGGMRFKRF